MNFYFVEDLRKLLLKKKSTYRLHICIKQDKITVLSSSKAYYNHCHGKNECISIHLEVSLSNFCEATKTLGKLCLLENMKIPCRKKRADAGKRHKMTQTISIPRNGQDQTDVQDILRELSTSNGQQIVKQITNLKWKLKD